VVSAGLAAFGELAAVAGLPFVVCFDQHGSGEAEQGLGVGEDPDDVSPPLDVLVQPLGRVRRPDHVTVYRWVQRFTALFADGTYVKVSGRWRYLYGAVDQYGQVIDVLLSKQRDTAAARRFFARCVEVRVRRRSR
jgi:hypothetical protein